MSTEMRMRQNYANYVSEIITSGNVSEMLNFMDEIVSISDLTYAASFNSNNLMTFSWCSFI